MTQLKIPMNFHSAELHVSSLCQTIVDAMAQAGADAEATVPKLDEVRTFAHELAVFSDNMHAAISGEILVSDDDSDDQRELRAAVARRGNPPNVSSLFPQVRISGDGPEAA